MPLIQSPLRLLRTMRLGDQLLVTILCCNVVYLVYHVNMAYLAPVEEISKTTETSHETAKLNEITLAPDPNRPNPCPVDSTTLLGPLACDCEPVSPDYLISNYRYIEMGGRLRPMHCQPQQRTAIIIPYRDRYDHLHSLLKMILPVVSRQQVDVTIFIIEQVEPLMFNRAALHNIGFLESLKKANFDCFIFHDVDLVPIHDHNYYRCGDQPSHLASVIKFGKWMSFTEMPLDYVGGVIAFTRRQYQLINGYSNLYFGSGGEDDDLFQRIVHCNLSIVRPARKVAQYEMLDHERQEGIQEVAGRLEILKSARQRQKIEGLNTSRYKVLYAQSLRLYTWINVSLNMTDVLKTAPIYTLRDMNKGLQTKGNI